MLSSLLLTVVAEPGGGGTGIPRPARNHLSSLPENVYVRNLFVDRITGPIEQARKVAPDLVREPGYGHYVQFFVQEQRGIVNFCFYHGRDTDFASPVSGSFIVQRDGESGELRRVKIFYKDDPGSYLSILPRGAEDSQMEIYLLGRKLQERINIPFPTEQIIRMPVARIMQLSSAYVNWQFYIPRQEFPPNVLTETDDLAEQIRPYLKELKDAEDGAIDSLGRYVYIGDGTPQSDREQGGLNCSGFVKWVVDGILSPITGELLSVDELKRPHGDYRGNRWSRKLEELEDPFFGLDWTRNLAIRAHQYVHGIEAQSPEDYDVRHLKYHQYKEDVGYPVEQLPTLLYELARDSDNYLYLGSVNELFHGENEVRKHYHVAAFLPWLDQNGRLEVALFDRNREIDLESFIRTHQGAHIHLVRIPHRGVFQPFDLRLEPVLNR